MKIITDSSCDLPKKYFEENDISVIPLNLEIDGKNYIDIIDISHDSFYKKMSSSENLPKTSQPSPNDFQKEFEKQINENKDILSLHLSSKLSGTFDAASLASKNLDDKISVFDTLSGSVGLGLQVLKAKELISLGYNKEKIIESLKEYRDQMNIVVYLESLENAVKGGRVSRPKRFLVELLNLKPIVHVEDGLVKILKTVRGKKKGINFLLEEIERKNVDYKDKIIGITHCDCLDEALKLKEKIMEKFSPKDIILTTMGPVISSHAGKGGLLVCF